jgi:hypothetical protein
MHRTIRAILVPALALIAGAALAAPSPPSQKSEDGKYIVTLRPLPADGLVAGEETDIEFFVGDARRVDPVLGPAPVIRARVRGRFTMPAMPGMPAAQSEAHVEGQPGYYGVVTAFPHGGEYVLTLSIAPPGDAPFTVQFPLKVQDGTGKPRVRPYSVRLETSPREARAGRPVELRFHIYSRQEPKKALTVFEQVHEQLMHLIIVSRDLGYFDHVHPELDPKTGTFTLTHTFPAGGEYRLFCDTTPKDAGTQVLVAPLRVSGTPAPEAKLTASASLQASTGDVVIDLKPDATPLQARTDHQITLGYTRAGGAPVTDLQPWLGALGHVVLIHEDAETMVHSHPQEEVPPRGTPTPSRLRFYARFPKPGLYKGWAQFQRDGRVLTAPFVLRVAGEA